MKPFHHPCPSSDSDGKIFDESASNRVYRWFANLFEDEIIQTPRVTPQKCFLMQDIPCD